MYYCEERQWPNKKSKTLFLNILLFARIFLKYEIDSFFVPSCQSKNRSHAFWVSFFHFGKLVACLLWFVCNPIYKHSLLYQGIRFFLIKITTGGIVGLLHSFNLFSFRYNKEQYSGSRNLLQKRILGAFLRYIMIVIVFKNCHFSF